LGVEWAALAAFTMNKDRCSVRAGARRPARMRDLALALLRTSGKSVSAAREGYVADCPQI
jgi:hypothetical protein